MADLQLIKNLSEIIGIELNEVDHKEIKYQKNSRSYSLSAENNIIGLNLSKSNLSEFPKIISKFEHLEIINFNQNFLEEKPDQIKGLKKLKQLSFSGTGLSDYSFLSGMNSLEILTLRDNNLFNLSSLEFIIKLKLKELKLNNNFITTLPNWLFELGLNVGIGQAIDINKNLVFNPPMPIIKKGKGYVLDYFNSISKGAKMRLKIFLAHSTKDKEIVNEIHDKLGENVEKIWLDEYEFVTGDHLKHKAEEAIKTSDLAIICWSKNVDNSKGFIKKEIEIIRQEAQKRSTGSLYILPIILDDTPVPDYLKNLFHESWTKDKDINGTRKAIAKKWEEVRKSKKVDLVALPPPAQINSPRSPKYSFNKTELSFVADDNKTYHFCIKNGLPDRLGDGFFGVVYRVRNSDNKEMAFKIFYEKSKTLEVRYKKERAVVKELLKKDQKLTGLIKTEAGTDEFRINNKKADKEIRRFFNDQGINISKYGLILPLYDTTLKGLLEEPNFGASKSGYEILKSCNFKDRTATILPFLETIVVGLEKLYSEEYTHLDLKPANIFVKKKEVGSGFEAVVADLGFLDTDWKNKIETDSGGQHIEEGYFPYGTKHYRSPEQKDYSDICNVDVQIDIETNLVKLIVYDPKFEETIIEKGDWLRFSKSPKQVYEIKDILTNQSQGDKKGTIVLFDKPERQDLILEEKGTLVLLYKDQRLRTDLFGLGAIAYDMITCGKSPERFYDNIRGMDKPTVNTSEQDVTKSKDSIAELLENYNRFTQSQSIEPYYYEIFKPFQSLTTQDYAPTDLVELILKSMLYKADQTYYHAYFSKSNTQENEKDEVSRGKREAGILKNVKNIISELISKKFNYSAKNFLVSPPDEKVEEAKELALSEILSKKNESQKAYHITLFKGVKYLDLLIKLVNKKVFGNNADQYFSEILPGSIRIKSEESGEGSLDFYFSAFGTKSDYVDYLNRDRVYVKLTGSNENIFVPKEFVYMRRKISLSQSKENINETKDLLTFKYNFTTTSFPGDLLNEDDWILFPLTIIKNEKQRLWRVCEIDRGQRTIKIKCHFKDSGRLKEEEVVLINNCDTIIYYRNLDRYAYYFYLLGIYIQQLFFVKVGMTNNELPEYVEHIKYHLRNNPYKLKFRTVDTIMNELNPSSFPHREFLRIMLSVTNMFVKLIFMDSPKSYYKLSKEDRMMNVASHSDGLIEMVTNFFNHEDKKFPIRHVNLDNDIFKEGTSEYERISTKLPDELEKHKYVNLDFLLKKTIIVKDNEPAPVSMEEDQEHLEEQLQRESIELEQEQHVKEQEKDFLEVDKTQDSKELDLFQNSKKGNQINNLQDWLKNKTSFFRNVSNNVNGYILKKRNILDIKTPKDEALNNDNDKPDEKD